MTKSTHSFSPSSSVGGVGEAIFELSEHTDTTVFYGVNNSNIHTLKNLYPNLRFTARGHAIKISGSENETQRFISKLEKIERYCIDNNQLSETNIIEIIKDGSEPEELKFDHLILHGVNSYNFV